MVCYTIFQNKKNYEKNHSKAFWVNENKIKIKITCKHGRKKNYFNTQPQDENLKSGAECGCFTLRK